MMLFWMCNTIQVYTVYTVRQTQYVSRRPGFDSRPLSFQVKIWTFGKIEIYCFLVNFLFNHSIIIKLFDFHYKFVSNIHLHLCRWVSSLPSISECLKIRAVGKGWLRRRKIRQASAELCQGWDQFILMIVLSHTILPKPRST